MNDNDDTYVPQFQVRSLDILTVELDWDQSAMFGADGDNLYMLLHHDELGHIGIEFDRADPRLPPALLSEWPLDGDDDKPFAELIEQFGAGPPSRRSEPDSSTEPVSWRSARVLGLSTVTSGGGPVTLWLTDWRRMADVDVYSSWAVGPGRTEVDHDWLLKQLTAQVLPA